MQPKAKANSVVTHVLSDAGVITFTVRDAGTFTFDPAKASDAIRARAAIHGFIQRISDGAAMSTDPLTGTRPSALDKLDRMRRIAEHYETGGDEWSIRPAGAQTESGLVILAMVRAGLATDGDAANELVTRLMAKRTIERRAALDVWASTTKVAEALAAIRAERAAKVAERADLDADDLLSEMDDGDADGATE